MKQPNDSNMLVEERRNIRYEVIAYRSLARPELIRAVRVALSMMKKKPKRNGRYRFVTVIGAKDAA